MPTQILPAASLRGAQRLRAARALFLAANYLICLALWSIGRAVFRAAANFLPALREGCRPSLSPLARGEGLRGLFGRGDGRLLPAEARGVGAVDERLGTLARQVFEPVDPGVDVVFPHLARHLIEELDTVAVRVVDVDAVGHAMVDAPVELDPTALQELELLEPGFAIGHRQRHMVDRDLAVSQHPVSGRRQVRALDQRDGVMGQLRVIDRTVKPHLRGARAIGPLVQLADLLEADDLGPEFVRLLDVADIQHQVVDAGRAHRLSRGVGIRLCHSDLPKSVGYLVLRLAGSSKGYARFAVVTGRRTSVSAGPISVASKASSPTRSSASGCGRRRQQVSASAFSAAIPSPRPSPFGPSASPARANTGQPRRLPGERPPATALAQQKVSRTVSIGVAQAPTMPLSSFTPVKNTPTTARSTVMRSRSAPRVSAIVSRVSCSIGVSIGPFPVMGRAAGAVRAGSFRKLARRAIRFRRHKADRRFAGRLAARR